MVDSNVIVASLIGGRGDNRAVLRACLGGSALPVIGDDGVTRMLRACADGPVLRGERVRWSDLGTIPLEALGAPRALHVMEDS